MRSRESAQLQAAASCTRIPKRANISLPISVLVISIIALICEFFLHSDVHCQGVTTRLAAQLSQLGISVVGETFEAVSWDGYDSRNEGEGDDSEDEDFLASLSADRKTAQSASTKPAQATLTGAAASVAASGVQSKAKSSSSDSKAVDAKSDKIDDDISSITKVQAYFALLVCHFTCR